MERANLYDMVAVKPVRAGSSGTEIFRGEPVPGPYGRVFGGQLVGQSVSAATATVQRLIPARNAHSLHASFVRAGNSSRSIDYEVSVVRDGKSFSVRSVRALQGEQLLMTATLSFQVPTEGLASEAPCEPGYPDPDSLKAGDDDFAPPVLAGGKPGHRTAVEIRRVPPALDPLADGIRSGQAVWIRAAAPQDGVGEQVGRAVLAMTTDFTVLESAVRGHGLTLTADGVSVASLDHALWWHAPAELNEWVLYVQESPWSGGERALITGRVYDRGGRLLASIAQEGLLRASESAAAGRLL